MEEWKGARFFGGPPLLREDAGGLQVRELRRSLDDVHFQLQWVGDPGCQRPQLRSRDFTGTVVTWGPWKEWWQVQ